MFKHPLHEAVVTRLIEPRRFIQVLSGPRQVGKTHLARQVIQDVKLPAHYASADFPVLRDLAWLEQQWETARFLCHAKKPALLVLDEIQKLPNWSELIKKLWDDDTAYDVPLQVLLLDSSSLLIQQRLSESLAGRFEIIPITQWGFAEMRAAFGFDLDQYVFFGGYPGSAILIHDIERWRNYINESLLETTLSRDILLMSRIDKPALLRRLFYLGCRYSGQIISLQKILGQLQDTGNVTTVSHYLELLSGAGLLTGLSKYSPNLLRQKASSPKLQVMTTALMSAPAEFDFRTAKENQTWWGRLVESTVGAHLFNSAKGKGIHVYYWRERGKEVDFVLQRGDFITAIEVKSGTPRDGLPGMQVFSEAFKPQRKLLIGPGGIELEKFLETPILRWVS
jgi:hypothetical protein